MNNLSECIQEIVNRGFPELKGVDISANYKKMNDAYFEFARNSRREYNIDVDKTLKNVKKKVILGGMSHELAHIYRETKMNIFFSWIDSKLYDLFSYYESWDERKTDILVLKRGLGKELLAFLKYADKRREKYNSSDGLTVEELEKIIT